MKTVVLLRHGHADDGVDDHARSLTPAGQEAARAAAEELLAANFRADVILSSTAARARQTADIAASLLSFAGGIDERKELYLAEPSTYLAALHNIDEHANNVLLVPHNPGLEQLAAQFGHKKRLAPARYYLVRREVSRWAAFRP